MPNPEGTPVWYELISPDPAASKKFYDHVIGWTIDAEPMSSEMDYRGINVASGGQVGGVMRLSDDMAAHGGKATWLFYIGVGDVDASLEKIKANGGSVLMPAWDIPGIGRIAMVADPQGNPFYVMRPIPPADDPDATSTVFDRFGMGKCNWNELNTPDQAGANQFYADTFGWTYPDKMTMPGDMGDYTFIDAAGQTIGATMTLQPGDTQGWRFYFRTPDIEDTAKKVGDSGGTVLAGPMEVPGGDRIIVAKDPHGVTFGAVGPGNQ